VGVLKYIHEHFCDGPRSPFQIFAGTSCGSLNTTFYAAQSSDAYASRLWLEELWRGFHVPAYHGNVLKNALKSLYKEWRRHPSERLTAWALLDPKPMQDVIIKGFLRDRLERSFAVGSTCGVAVAATEIISSRLCWFQEGPHARAWNLFHSIGIIEPITVQHVAASCSVPVFLPPVKLGNHFFLDGSISMDRPFSAAINMGASRILSIATDRPSPADLPSYQPIFRPRITNVIRLLLNRLGRDATIDEAVQIEMFNRFYDTMPRQKKWSHAQEAVPLFHKEALPSHYRPVQVCMLFPSRRIRNTSITADPTGSEPRRARTRFMFHEKFIGELIELGYGDARDQHRELKDFFAPNPSGQIGSWLGNFGRRSEGQ